MWRFGRFDLIWIGIDFVAFLFVVLLNVAFLWCLVRDCVICCFFLFVSFFDCIVFGFDSLFSYSFPFLLSFRGAEWSSESRGSVSFYAGI
jgi:hypothetical protein